MICLFLFHRVIFRPASPGDLQIGIGLLLIAADLWLFGRARRDLGTARLIGKTELSGGGEVVDTGIYAYLLESTVHRNDCFYLRRVPAGGDSADVGGLRRVACAGADCDWIRRTRVAWTAGRAVRRILPEGAAIYSLPDAGARKVNSNADAEECA